MYLKDKIVNEDKLHAAIDYILRVAKEVDNAPNKMEGLEDAYNDAKWNSEEDHLSDAIDIMIDWVEHGAPAEGELRDLRNELMNGELTSERCWAQGLAAVAWLYNLPA